MKILITIFLTVFSILNYQYSQAAENDAKTKVTQANKALFAEFRKGPCENDNDCVQVRGCGGCCNKSYVSKTYLEQFNKKSMLICEGVPELCANKLMSCPLFIGKCRNKQCFSALIVNHKTGELLYFE